MKKVGTETILNCNADIFVSSVDEMFRGQDKTMLNLSEHCKLGGG
jgi:hypothetical protein